MATRILPSPRRLLPAHVFVGAPFLLLPFLPFDAIGCSCCVARRVVRGSYARIRAVFGKCLVADARRPNTKAARVRAVAALRSRAWRAPGQPSFACARTWRM